MNPWGEFAQIFLLFSAGVTGLVFLVKYVAKKWIDAAFAVKMKELDHQYALLQQRENVKYAKTFEARWNAILQLPYILKDLEQSVTFAHTFLIPVGWEG